jgi:alpha-galactosidase
MLGLAELETKDYKNSLIKEITVAWQELGYPAHLSAKVRDLWQGKDLGQHAGKFSARVAPHTVVMVSVKP